MSVERRSFSPSWYPRDAEIAALAALVTADPERTVSVDLERQTIACGDVQFSFSIDPVSRNQLLNGWDDVDLTESHRAEIAAFKAKDKESRPWAVPMPT